MIRRALPAPALGGWSIEKWTRVPRAHEYTDISTFASDAEAFRHFLADSWTTWNIDDRWRQP